MRTGSEPNKHWQRKLTKKEKRTEKERKESTGKFDGGLGFPFNFAKKKKLNWARNQYNVSVKMIYQSSNVLPLLNAACFSKNYVYFETTFAWWSFPSVQTLQVEIVKWTIIEKADYFQITFTLDNNPKWHSVSWSTVSDATSLRRRRYSGRRLTATQAVTPLNIDEHWMFL